MPTTKLTSSRSRVIAYEMVGLEMESWHGLRHRQMVKAADITASLGPKVPASALDPSRGHSIKANRHQNKSSEV